MNDGLYDLLSKRAKIALNVLTGIAAVALLYSFHFLSQGPMQSIARWTADSDGQYYFELAFMLSFLPICMAEWLIVYGVDRCISRWKSRPPKAPALPIEVVRRIE